MFIKINFVKGKFDLSEATISVNGQSIASGSASSGSMTVDYTFTASSQPISVTIKDAGGYSTTQSFTGPTISSKSSNDG